MRRHRAFPAILLATCVAIVAHGPAAASMTQQQCFAASQEWIARVRQFGLSLVPFKNDVLKTMSAGGNIAAVKCAHARAQDQNLARISQLVALQVRNCPGARFLDPARSAEILQQNRAAEAQYCGRR